MDELIATCEVQIPAVVLESGETHEDWLVECSTEVTEK